jgi:DMSO/TMAO reductase YedYZ heme-binding membrane subunit
VVRAAATFVYAFVVLLVVGIVFPVVGRVADVALAALIALVLTIVRYRRSLGR